jgi:hypothetical protein
MARSAVSIQNTRRNSLFFALKVCAMRTIGTSITLALAMAGLIAPVRAAGPFAPARLRIEPAGRVDLGELGPLEVRTRSYRFANLSAAPIALRVLDLSPGVSVAGPALERPIPGGGSAGLELRVDPTGWSGPQARNVRLGTDDPGQGSFYLPVRMTVRPDLTVDGRRRSFGDVGVNESPSSVFQFTRETGKTLTLRVVTPLPAYLECELRPGGPGVQLAFTLRPGRIPPGMRLGLDQVQVETNAPLEPRFDLYLEWRVHHPIEPIPQRLVFVEPEDTLVLRLRSRGAAPFRILGAELEGDGFQLDWPSGPAAPEQTLQVRRTAAGAARAMLVVRCSGQDDPLRVPVAYIPDRPIVDEDVIVVPNKND